ncbi:uncharacterized protein LOC133192183 [Saccostrea echinata]|uniref:uncharacterized protein LOC133192183 n=1 Tax=Saccostrea echinata TaxID=191078 RepID=UPI002A7EB139|nr:uncharacterized protein LOC133192183 [Saccostrea echinata]
MDSSADDFEVVDATNDAYDEREGERSSMKSEELCAGEEFRSSLQLSFSGEDQSKNVTLSLKDLDLADFILDDLSLDGSDHDSEFSFVEMPKAHDTEIELAAGEDFATTPASSAWSLLDSDFTSDSDRELPESEGSSSCLASDDDIEIQKEEASPSDDELELQKKEEKVPKTDSRKANKRSPKKKRSKQRTKTEQSMIKQLFGELSVCQNEEDDKLPDFVESGSAPTVSDIPSLVDLCMRKIHLYRKRHQIKKFIKSSWFPVGMRQTILSSNLQYSLTKSYLLWLQQNVSAFESWMIEDKKKGYTRDDDRIKFSFCFLSNLWKDEESANSVLIEACFDKRINDDYIFYDKREYYLVYATLMNFMMENTSKYVEDKGYSGRKFLRAKGVTGNTQSKQLAVVHQFLKSRYPHMTEVYFEKSVPYVYWARGKYRESLLAFVKLYKEGSLSDKEKLFIIGEIGRMYAMKYEPEKAVRMYRLLGNCLIQARPSESEMTECQTLILIADLQNQGVLTESKARNFLSSWKAVFRVCLTSRCSDLYLETAESLLRLHLGHLQVGNHLEMMKCVLREYSKHSPKIWYHLAFLNAIMGHSKSSDNSYGEFYKCFQGPDADVDEEARRSIPGMQMVDILRERKLALVHQNYDPLQLAVQNPFEPLISLGGVPVMKVIWRRQFHYSSYYTDHDHEVCSGFDISNPDLKLRMTKDGFITGDCSMIYPPIANILLNPHTGSLTFKPDSPGLNAWKMFPFTTPRQYYCDRLCTHLPNVVEIFHQHGNDGDFTAYLTGNHFFKVSRNSVYWRYNNTPKTDQVINVHWSGPGNQRAKFSLVQKMKDYMYQKAVADISVHALGGAEIVREATSLVEKWYKQGWIITSNVVKIAASTVKETLADKRTRKHKVKRYKLCEFKMKFLCQPQRIGSSSVLLSVQVSVKYFYLIIKCQDRSSFMNPVIFEAFENDIAYTFSRSSYFCMKRPDGSTIYDCEGHEVQKTFPRHIPCFNMTLIENNLIFFNKKRLGLHEINDGWIKYFDDFMECEFVGVQLDILILTNEYGIKFADGRKKCLKPMTILLDSSILQSDLPFKISENQEQLNGSFAHVEVLAEESEETGAFTVNNCVILFTVSTSQDSFREINITKVLQLPGLPVRLKFLHKSVGFLVTWTQHSNKDKDHRYREHLFQYSYTGQLLAVLPFLGQLQSSLCVEYLEEDKEITNTYQSCGHKGWYLYLQDGRQGVMCVRLVQE